MAINGVEVLFFDVFGTVVNWHGSVKKEMEDIAAKHKIEGDWSAFAKEWRKGYFDAIKRVNEGSKETVNTDEMMRINLDKMLSSDKWSQVAAVLGQEERHHLTYAWHRLSGWSDSVPGLEALKKKYTIVALSNGNLRLLVDMAKYANLPWDAVLSTELFNTFKPNPEVYLSAMRHFSVPPEKAAMVACHHWDLEAAASNGMKTIYVSRPEAHEPKEEPAEIKLRKDGGIVDLHVNSFAEIAGEGLNAK